MYAFSYIFSPVQAYSNGGPAEMLHLIHTLSKTAVRPSPPAGISSAFLWFDISSRSKDPGEQGVSLQIQAPWSASFTNELLFLIVWVVTREFVLISVMVIWIVTR